MTALVVTRFGSCEVHRLTNPKRKTNSENSLLSFQTEQNNAKNPQARKNCCCCCDYLVMKRIITNNGTSRNLPSLIFWTRYEDYHVAISQPVYTDRGAPPGEPLRSARDTSCRQKCETIWRLRARFRSKSSSGPVPNIGCLLSTAFTSTLKKFTNPTSC